jgi:ADP-ribose pyrophosphatase YjhB (NUDIX family)
MKYCNQCGAPLELKIPPGDDRERHVCSQCSTVHYRNPRIITGCLPVFEDSVLLCKRAIEPRSGYWTLPAGFLESGESIAEGAVRETLEEACAEVEIQHLYGVIDILHISQIYIFYLAHLKNLDFRPGNESLETRLFSAAEIPWEELAFPSVTWILEHYFDDIKHGKFSLKTDIMDASKALYMVNRDRRQ